MNRLAKATRFFNTLKYLKPVQIYRRIWFCGIQPKPDMRPAPYCREQSGTWVSPCSKAISFLYPFCFRFLNKKINCDFPADWNNPNYDKLWLYNLHYFDDLNGEEAGDRLPWHLELIEQWIEDNVPGKGNGWEPYPLSLRIVNWIKWALKGNELPSKVVHNLAVQIRYLRKRIEFHLLGNHLFANAKALVFAGLFYKGAEAEKWLKQGMKIIEDEISEQILSDGGHFERSPMYHSIIFEDILDLINAFIGYGQSPPLFLSFSAREMFAWLRVMCHPDGEIVLFNDAAFGIASGVAELEAYAARLGIQNIHSPKEGVTLLADSGYVRWQNGAACVFLDVGEIGPDYLPGHAHADTLSFEFSLLSQRIVVDSGTSCYGNSAERLRQRGSAAHNTVIIDEENSSEIWGGFRVARRSKPFDLEILKDTEKSEISCSHDGYLRLPGKSVHRRKWLFNKNSMRVKDTVTGTFGTACSRFHFHPDLEIKFDQCTVGYVILPSGEKIKWEIKKGGGHIIATTYHPEFGVCLPNKCLEITFIGPETEIIFTW